ncbi:MAG: formate/nitrite transporter family protein [Verrucomicrobia bacterium]|nr:formate/nitrite transporter family protein [Verrucomicrobiota bacterium]
MGVTQTDQQKEPLAEQRERAEVQERIAPSAGIVYATIVQQGEDELARPYSALAFSGLAAGLSMGFSFLAEALLTVALPDTPWRELITKFGYSFGFLIVILGRQQLFTENTLTPVLPLLREFTREKLVRVIGLWAVVLAANMVGVSLFACVLAKTGILDEPVRQTLRNLGEHVFAGSPEITFVRATFAGWLIALMVWLLPFAETARVSVIILLTYLIGLGRFDHIIAGSTEKLYLLFSGLEGVSAFLLRFWLPTLLGNMCGGILLVAVLNHGQVIAGKGD